MKIAVIGLGTMGAPMAENLIKAGFEVTVHNRTRSREEPLATLGATRADSAAAAGQDADIVLTCVSDTPDVERVLLDPEHGAINGLKEGSLMIDCSSISPEATRRIAEAFRAQGIGYVDAPVSGGSEGAIHGTLTIMCGGSEEDFERAQPVLQVIGSKVTRIGPVGCGQIAKVANQVVIAGTFMALGEALTLAFRAGADPERVAEAIGGGALKPCFLPGAVFLAAGFFSGCFFGGAGAGPATAPSVSTESPETPRAFRHWATHWARTLAGISS